LSFDEVLDCVREGGVGVICVSSFDEVISLELCQRGVGIGSGFRTRTDFTTNLTDNDEEHGVDYSYGYSSLVSMSIL
jgi:hypothetical protein